jgi:RNA polymerase-interacting CarD/CdnL/TRCF family regulator
MKIGDAILHPRYGVGIIQSIEKRLEDGVTRDYYVIPKPSISSKIFVPVDAADELGLRPLATAERLEQAVSILSGKADDTSLYAEEHTISWGDPIDLARVIRIGAIEAKPHTHKVTQQNQLKRAKMLLTEELSAVLGLSEESITALVGTKAKR